MRIEWLNENMREARLTRGFWRWKRVAIVKRELGESWQYAVSGDLVETRIKEAIDIAYWEVRRAQDLDKLNRNWQPARPVPSARVIK